MSADSNRNEAATVNIGSSEAVEADVGQRLGRALKALERIITAEVRRSSEKQINPVDTDEAGGDHLLAIDDARRTNAQVDRQGHSVLRPIAEMQAFLRTQPDETQVWQWLNGELRARTKHSDYGKP